MSLSKEVEHWLDRVLRDIPFNMELDGISGSIEEETCIISTYPKREQVTSKTKHGL